MMCDNTESTLERKWERCQGWESTD